MRYLFRLLLSLFLIAVVSCSSRAAAADSTQAFQDAVGEFFSSHCLACHGPDNQEGELRIDELSTNVGVRDTALWIEVMERISSGEMPPEDAPRHPDPDVAAEIVEWLANRIKAGEAARMAQRGFVSFHRLTREEYVNTIYDLLGVHYDATDPGGFTEDPEWRGFERIGSVLSLSPSHVEKYFQATEIILAEAYPDEEIPLLELHKKSVPNVGEPHRSRLEELGLLDKVRFDLWPQDKHRYSSPGHIPAAGVYEVTFQLSGLKPAEGRAPRLHVYHEKLDRVLFAQDIVAPEDAPVKVTFQTHLPEGHQQIIVINDVPGPSNLPRSGRHGRKPFVSIKHGRIPWQLKLTDEQGHALYPFLILDWVEWKGPLVTPAEQHRRDSFLATEVGNLAQAQTGLERLARRAFRRPLLPGEINKYVEIVKAELAAGAEFRSAVKTGMLSILCSKSFLFLVEGSPEENRRQLNDWELASRLSYFLWSTMPDETLFELAADETLSNPDVLLQQVERMLSDPRAERFSESFPRQWLQLRKVGMFPPDKQLYPDYDTHLENSMIRETTSFFRRVLQDKLTLREFLVSDWTMLNPRLALHYGIPGIVEDRFQRVTLEPDTHRGGLLTQAAILSLTSDGTRHRPVHRGVWLSESILGRTPPPPPANVAAIEPNPVDSPKATLRMKLTAHKHDPNCASCHRKIDPLGLAFENFDAIGRWRDVERVQQGTGENPPVDATGELVDGRTYQNAREFKQLLLDDIDQFGRTFIEKLATFGLRRAITYDDQEEIDNIAAEAKRADYQVHATIIAFTTSELFRSR